jgi:hypothetical protein
MEDIKLLAPIRSCFDPAFTFAGYQAPLKGILVAMILARNYSSLFSEPPGAKFNFNVRVVACSLNPSFKSTFIGQR